MFLANSKRAKRKTRFSQNVLISLRVGLCRFVKTATIYVVFDRNRGYCPTAVLTG